MRASVGRSRCPWRPCPRAPSEANGPQGGAHRQRAVPAERGRAPGFGHCLLLSTGAQYSPVLSEDWRGVLALSAAAKLYEQSDWNDMSVQGDVGIARLFDRGSASGGLRLGRDGLAGNATAMESVRGCAVACGCRRPCG